MNNKISNTLHFILQSVVMSIALITVGCSDIGDANEFILETKALRFTDDPDFDAEDLYTPEFIYVDSSEQIITLHCKPAYNDIPAIQKFYFAFPELDESEGFYRWIYYGIDEFTDSSNMKNEYCHVWNEIEEGEPVIKIKLNANDSDTERKMHINISAGIIYQTAHVFGLITIVQSPSKDKTNSFVLKAKYKGHIYTTDTDIDTNGCIVYHNNEYRQIMETIDLSPYIHEVIMDNDLIYYYDDEDIATNKPLQDLMNSDESRSETKEDNTRSTSFEGISSNDKGYVALHDNDNFGGKYISKGLTNYHFTWNLPNLKDYGMNDNVTSIAVAYNGEDPNICSVLTIWDDSDYNFGDNSRKKHRISIIASKYNQYTSVADLKKIKKIGSSKSWNDCISSISFHFGYTDRLLLDY